MLANMLTSLPFWNTDPLLFTIIMLIIIMTLSVFVFLVLYRGKSPKTNNY